MKSIGKNIGTFALFVAVGAGLSLGIRAVVRGGGDADAEEPEHDHGRHPAKQGAPAEKPPARLEVLVDLGNEKCPVMGGKVDGKTYTFWNGLRIGHCCPGCTKPLLEKPEELLDEMKLEWRELAKAAALANAAEGADRAGRVSAIGKKHEIVERDAGLLIDLGNEKCPVMGGKVDGKTYTEWNGLRIGHCCPGCTKPLLENPERLLDEMKLEWRQAAKLAALANNATGDARATLVAEAKNRFEVVRE